jgi:hypothetical protein
VRARNVDLPNAETLNQTIEHSLALQEHLEQFFATLSAKGKLPNFDKRRAGAALRVYLDEV